MAQWESQSRRQVMRNEMGKYGPLLRNSYVTWSKTVLGLDLGSEKWTYEFEERLYMKWPMVS